MTCVHCLRGEPLEYRGPNNNRAIFQHPQIVGPPVRCSATELCLERAFPGARFVGANRWRCMMDIGHPRRHDFFGITDEGQGRAVRARA